MRRATVVLCALATILGGLGVWLAGGTPGHSQEQSGARNGARNPAQEVGAAKAAGQAPGGYEFVAPLEAVMEKVDDVYYKAMPEKLKKEDFKAIRMDALFLAEMANLASHYKEHRGKKKFADLAASMKGDMLKLAEAAEKKDNATAKSLHNKVEETCDSCHEEFRDQ